MDLVFKIIGAVGLIFVTLGILQIRNRIKQYFFFVVGGLFLLTYSTYLKDPVFITLQIIATLAAIFELLKLESKKH